MISRYYHDCEFIEAQWKLTLISIALVCDDGRELYLVSNEFKDSECSDWVKQHVLPLLPPRSKRVSLAEITRQVRAFVTGKPEFWADFGAYDFVLLCWVFGGRMVDMPDGYPMHVMDMQQALIDRSISSGILPPHLGAKHSALDDARHLRDCCLVALNHEDNRPLDPGSRKEKIVRALLEAMSRRGCLGMTMLFTQQDVRAIACLGVEGGVSGLEVEEALDWLRVTRADPTGRKRGSVFLAEEQLPEIRARLRRTARRRS